SAADPADVFTEALEAANSGLDYLSATGQTHGRIVQANDDCILWWPDGSGGVIMRAMVVDSVPFNMPPMYLTVTRPDGTVPQPPPPPTPISHDVLRFIRMAKTSDDLFDAYRNLFLALECLLDGIHPHRSGGEGVWFKAALSTANSLVPVAQLAPPNETHPVEWVYQHIYGGERSGLVHAKQKWGYLRPHDSASRADLGASLENLWRYVRDLTAKHLDVTSGSASMSPYGWAEHADPHLRTFIPFVSDDANPFVNDGQPHPLDSTVASVQATATAPVADTTDPMLRTVTGSFNPADLRQLDIRKLGALVTGNNPGAIGGSDLTGPLRLGTDVSRFEVVLGLRNFSANGAPTVFSS
ncbi:MAG: hypothetical protein QOH27_5991, partial [Mycobacterium sp.]|nr:hypothetical protein [Mycobacterium sp.]